MKKLKKVSLASLSKQKLEKREQNRILGGDNCCACPCSGSGNARDAAIYGLGGGLDYGYGIGRYA